MTTLWLPKEVFEMRTRQTQQEEARRLYEAKRPRHPFEVNLERLHAGLESGLDMGQLAKEIATYVYDHNLERNFCEHTGYPYFHECDCY